MHPIAAGLLLLVAHPAAPRADLVANVRAALHVDAPAWKSTLMTGTATYYSEPHTFSFQFQQDGRFTQVMKGALGESFGYDGKTYWEADRSGAPRILDFEDADVQQALIIAQTNEWLNPPAGVTVTHDANNILVKLASGLEENIAIDPTTNLPTVATFTISPGLVTVKLSDWRTAGEWKVPAKTEVTMGGLTDTYVADKVENADPAAYSVPTWVPNNIKFDPAIPNAVEVKKLFTGHIIVHPLINGKDVGWFILDSGADIVVVDKVVADNLNLPKVGRLPLVGVGGIEEQPFRTVSELKLGPATLDGTQCAEMDLAPYSKVFQVEIAGIIGFDLFRRSIISVDLDKPAVSIFDPSTFKLPEGQWTPTKFSTGNIALQARMEGGRTGWFRLDTGANGTVQFHAPFVRKEHLLDNRNTTDVEEGGAGGSSHGKKGTIDWFELAGHRFEQPEAVFSLATVGAFNDSYLAGNIGQDFMKPFVVYFDFGGSRVALLPKAK
jgi:hypothetical protein